MMMARTFHVLKFVCEVKRTAGREPATLHGKAMQGQQHQQKNADNAAHGGKEGE